MSRWTTRWRAPHDIASGAGVAARVAAAVLTVALGLQVLTPPASPPTAAAKAGPATHARLLASNGGVFTPYTAQELFGGGSTNEECWYCDAEKIAGAGTGAGVQPGQPVNAATGDYTTTDQLFDVTTLAGSYSLALTYSSQLAQYQQAAGGTVSGTGTFGPGWSAAGLPSLTPDPNNGPRGTETVNEESGAEVTFTQAAASTCPSGDYEDPQKYTVPGSAVLYCAANRLDAQLGWFPATNSYELYESGGKTIVIFNSSGEVTGVTDLALWTNGGQYAYTYTPNATPGATGCPTVSPAPGYPQVSQCTVMNLDGQTVSFLLNASKDVIEVEDGVDQTDYSFGYTGNLLTSIGEPLPSGTKTTTFAYQSSYASPFNAEMHTITDPAGTTTISYRNPGSYTTTNGVDTFGSATSVQDPAGNTTGYSYVQTGCGACTNTTQTTTVTLPDGEVDVASYLDGVLLGYSFGSATKQSPYYQSWSFNYSYPSVANQDGPTVLTAVYPGAASNTQTVVLTTDSVGNPLSVQLPGAGAENFMYNDTGGNDLSELCWAANPGVAIPPTVSCKTPPAGSTTYAYDAYGEQTADTDPLGDTTRSGWTTQGLECWTAEATVTGAGTCASPPTGSTSYAYDAYGDRTQTTTATGTASSATTLDEYYGPSVPGNGGKVLGVVPPDGYAAGSSNYYKYQATYTYFPDGRTESVSTPGPAPGSPLQTIDSYDSDGRLASSTDPAGVTTTAYDADSRACVTDRFTAVVAISGCARPGTGAATVTTYLADTTAPATVADAQGNTTTYTYADPEYPTRPTEIADPMGTDIAYTAYDAYGNACVTGPVQPATAVSCGYVPGDSAYSYDPMGDRLTYTDGNASADTWTYTYNDPAYPTRPTTVTNPLGRTDTTYYDANGESVLTADAETPTTYTTTAYDPDGRTCWQSPTNNAASVNTTTDTATTTGTCAAAPNGTGVTAYSYDANDRPATMVDNNGTASAVTSTYTFDLSANLLSLSDDNHNTVSYAYDDANNPVCVAYPISASQNCAAAPSATNTIVTRGYSTYTGQLTSVADWLGHTTTYGYSDSTDGHTPSTDGLGDITTIGYPTTTADTATYGYNNDRALTSAAYTGAVTGTQTWTPNADDQIGATTGLGGYSSNPTYSLDRVTANTTPGATAATNYRTAYNGELTQITAPTATTTLAYNASAQLTGTTTGAASTTYAYNADGQRCWSAPTTVTGPTCSNAPNGSTFAGWDAYGRLASYGPNTASHTYTYNGDGLRMTDTTGTTTHDDTWDTATNTLPLIIDDGVYAYIYGPLQFGGTAPIEQIRLSTSTATYLTATPTGVQDVLTQAGTTKQQTAYDTYGTPTIQTGALSSSFGFQGAYTDPTGLLYLDHRYYDPTTAQFLSVDPQLYQTGQPYVYDGGNPLNETDPSGDCFWCHFRQVWHYVIRHASAVSFVSGALSFVPVVGVGFLALSVASGALAAYEDRKHPVAAAFDVLGIVGAGEALRLGRFAKEAAETARSFKRSYYALGWEARSANYRRYARWVSVGSFGASTVYSAVSGGLKFT